jgi:hypothetical protein
VKAFSIGNGRLFFSISESNRPLLIHRQGAHRGFTRLRLANHQLARIVTPSAVYIVMVSVEQLRQVTQGARSAGDIPYSHNNMHVHNSWMEVRQSLPPKELAQHHPEGGR